MERSKGTVIVPDELAGVMETDGDAQEFSRV